MKVEGYRLVWQGEDENGLALGENLFEVGAADAITFFSEVVHCAVFARIEPFFEDTVRCR